MKKIKPIKILEYILLTLLAFLFLFPMVWMIVSAMKPEAEVYGNLTSWQAFLPSLNPVNWFKPYQEVLARFSVFTYLGNSIFYSTTFAIGSILINSFAGYAFARVDFTGKKFLFGFLLALLIIPVETVLIPQFTIVNALGLVNNRLAVIIPGLASILISIFLEISLLPFQKRLLSRLEWTGLISFKLSLKSCYLCLNQR